MFKINRRTDYAVRVGLALAKQAEGARVPTQIIQEEMQIPRPFLRRIIAELSKAGIVQTYTGPNGGIQLSLPPEQISLMDILTAMEGQLCISDCLQNPQDCGLSENCPVRSRWSRLQALIIQELSNTSLANLASEAQPLPTTMINHTPMREKWNPIWEAKQTF
jgi:Rrf2 family protein